MEYQDFNIKVPLAIGIQEVSLNIRLFHDKIYAGYSHGAYNHSLCMYANGTCNEVVDRNEKILTKNQYPAVPLTTFPSFFNQYGKIIGAIKTYFVVGAGNGIFGMGISKEERSKDCCLSLGVTDKSYFVLQVVSNFSYSEENYVFNAKTLDSE